MLQGDIMKRYEYVFVVLVYRTTEDLRSFFASLMLADSKVIVVNSYYDDVTDREFRAIAEAHDADFLTVENRGYGYGNNMGCRHALDNYDFRYLVISNADVIIEKWPENLQDGADGYILAPDIRTLSGKRQNPNIPFRPSSILENIEYRLYEGKHSKLIYAAHALSRMKKIIFYLCQSLSSRKMKIYSPHGAFIIIPRQILQKLYPLFNESMFLFNEERHLARLAERNGIAVIYEPDIRIKHMEDGSISTLNARIFDLSRSSYIEYYKYWINE